MENTAPSADAAAECPRCGKAGALCICRDIAAIDNRVAVLILQHPQEQDAALARRG